MWTNGSWSTYTQTVKPMITWMTTASAWYRIRNSTYTLTHAYEVVADSCSIASSNTQSIVLYRPVEPLCACVHRKKRVSSPVLRFPASHSIGRRRHRKLPLPKLDNEVIYNFFVQTVFLWSGRRLCALPTRVFCCRHHCHSILLCVKCGVLVVVSYLRKHMHVAHCYRNEEK